MCTEGAICSLRMRRLAVHSAICRRTVHDSQHTNADMPHLLSKICAVKVGAGTVRYGNEKPCDISFPPAVSRPPCLVQVPTVSHPSNYWCVPSLSHIISTSAHSLSRPASHYLYRNWAVISISFFTGFLVFPSYIYMPMDATTRLSHFGCNNFYLK